MEYHSYKVKLEGLQAKIRKSENERQELDTKFQHLMRERSDCEKHELKSIRSRYNRFLAEDQRRSERNDKLLQTLDRVDYQASALAAKTERLKLLKSQYEMYLMRAWSPQNAIHGPSSSLSTPRSNSYETPRQQLTQRFTNYEPLQTYEKPSSSYASSIPQDYDLPSNSYRPDFRTFISNKTNSTMYPPTPETFNSSENNRIDKFVDWNKSEEKPQIDSLSMYNHPNRKNVNENEVKLIYDGKKSSNVVISKPLTFDNDVIQEKLTNYSNQKTSVTLNDSIAPIKSNEIDRSRNERIKYIDPFLVPRNHQTNYSQMENNSENSSIAINNKVFAVAGTVKDSRNINRVGDVENIHQKWEFDKTDYGIKQNSIVGKIPYDENITKNIRDNEFLSTQLSSIISNSVDDIIIDNAELITTTTPDDVKTEFNYNIEKVVNSPDIDKIEDVFYGEKIQHDDDEIANQKIEFNDDNILNIEQNQSILEIYKPEENTNNENLKTYNTIENQNNIQENLSTFENVDKENTIQNSTDEAETKQQIDENVITQNNTENENVETISEYVNKTLDINNITSENAVNNNNIHNDTDPQSNNDIKANEENQHTPSESIITENYSTTNSNNINAKQNEYAAEAIVNKYDYDSNQQFDNSVVLNTEIIEQEPNLVYDESAQYQNEQYDASTVDPNIVDPNYDQNYVDPNYMDPNYVDPNYDPNNVDPNYDQNYVDPNYDPNYVDPNYDPNYVDQHYDPNNVDANYIDPNYDPNNVDPNYVDPNYVDPNYDQNYVDPNYVDPNYDQNYVDPNYVDPNNTDPNYQPQTDYNNYQTENQIYDETQQQYIQPQDQQEYYAENQPEQPYYAEEPGANYYNEQPTEQNYEGYENSQLGTEIPQSDSQPIYDDYAAVQQSADTTVEEITPPQNEVQLPENISTISESLSSEKLVDDSSSVNKNIVETAKKATLGILESESEDSGADKNLKTSPPSDSDFDFSAK